MFEAAYTVYFNGELSIRKLISEKEEDLMEKMGPENLIKLKGYVQNYTWGKLGKSSERYRISKSKIFSSGILECQILVSGESQRISYILSKLRILSTFQLWMGTHPKGPSLIMQSGQVLSKYLADNPAILGQSYKVTNTDNFQLPFLFKVLSVNEALSIQSHPNKQQAKILHANDPKNYPDDNHKPEMAIALTEFEMLSGFRPSSEIINYINELSELKRLIRTESYELFRANANEGSLKMCFSDLMNQPQVEIEKSLKSLADRFSSERNNNFSSSTIFLAIFSDFGDDQIKNLFLRIYKGFSNDVGCLAVFFLNYIVLQPGEAVFLGPNEPHAYLLGDCVECMACSDNTIRAGLTPKFKDVENLVAMLTYSMNAAEKVKFKPKKLSDVVTEYAPPVPEFTVHKIEVSKITT
uniref:mannose-6-phosphate isomerase n=1 Tax=Romanomermis culicivorax TaxID=13658 RepID=A0A915JVY8_ROMCU